MELNDRILNVVGGALDYPPNLPMNWQEEERFASLREEARVLVARFDCHTLWGWKDPRTSLTLPFWRSVCPDLKVVICIRHPLEVMVSLNRHMFHSLQLSRHLYLHYNQALLRDSDSSHRVCTHYDSYFLESHGELQRVCDALDMPISSEVIRSALAVIAPKLRHTRYTFQQLIDANLGTEMIDLSTRLCREAGYEGADLPNPPEIADAQSPASMIAPTSFTTNEDTLGSGIHTSIVLLPSLRAELAARDAAIVELQAIHEASMQAFAEARDYFEVQIANRDAAIVELQVNQDAAIAELQRIHEASMQAFTEARGYFEEQVANRDAAIVELQINRDAAIAELQGIHEASVQASTEAWSYFEEQVANRDAAIAELQGIHEASMQAFAEARDYFERQIVDRDAAIAELQRIYEPSVAR